MRKLHVLFLNTQPSLRADVSVHVSLARAIDRRQARVSVATSVYETPGDSARAAFASIPDLTLLPLNLGRPLSQQRGLGRVRAVLENLRGVATLLSLAAWCRRQRVDVIHVTERPRDALFGLLLARLAGTRCLVHAHTSYYAHPPSLSMDTSDWALRHADAVVGVSRFTAGTFQHDGKVPARRVFAVHNAIDNDLLQADTSVAVGAQMRQRLGIRLDAPVVGSVGRLMQGKDQASLLEAVASIRNTTPNVRLIVAGVPADSAPDGRGDYLDYLKRRVVELQLEDVVVFTGLLPHAEMPRLFATFDLFVHPCVEEPFGLVVVEAMASCRTVIAVNAGGIPEIIRNGVDGVLVGPRQPAALAEAIAALLGDSGRATQLARAGRERVLAAFTPDIQATAMLDVYRQVVTGVVVAAGASASQSASTGG